MPSCPGPGLVLPRPDLFPRALFTSTSFIICLRFIRSLSVLVTPSKNISVISRLVPPAVQVKNKQKPRHLKRKKAEMRSQVSLSVVALLAATVSAHGNLTSPPARLTGPAMVTACGQSAVANVDADPTIPLEDVFNALPSC